MSDNNPRVLHLISAEGNWEPFNGIVALTAALREYGIISVIAAPDHSRLWEMAEAAGVETVDYTLERSINPFRWKELGALVQSVNVDLVHSHDADAAALLSRSRIFGGATKVVASRYDMRSRPESAELGGGVDAIISPSEVMAELYRNSGAPAEKIHVVYCGVNRDTIDRAAEERDSIRASMRETYCPTVEKPRFLASIAPFDKAGNQKLLIEAMPDVLAALPQAHLFLMGDGQDREELERVANLNAVTDAVTFFEPDKAFHRLLAATDLYLAPGVGDASGFMVEAAMTAGCCVLAIDSGCHRELLDNGSCGVLADEKGENNFKSNMLSILKNRSRRDQLGKLARARARKEFAAQDQAKKAADIYRSLL